MASEGFKQSDVAVPTRSSRKSSPIILVATVFTASALCIWVLGLRSFSDLPRRAEMPHSLASVSTKEEPVATEAKNVQESLGRSETSSQLPILSSPPESSGGAGIIVATQPSPEVPPRTGPHPPLRRPLQNQKMGATWKTASPWLRAKNSRGLHRLRSKQALPLGGRASRFRSSGRACKSRQAFSPLLVNLNKVVDSGSSVLTDVRSCPFTPARTTWGKARRLTSGTIFGSTGRRSTTSG